MYPWNGSWHPSRVPVAWGPLQFQLQNICSRGDKLVVLVLPVLSWCISPSGVYVSQSPKSTALAVQGKPGGIVVPEDLYGLGYTYGYRFPSGQDVTMHTHTQAQYEQCHVKPVWIMQVATHICFLVVVASQWPLGHTFILLQSLNRLLGLKINVSIIVLGFNWVHSLLNGNTERNRKRFCPW